MRILYITPHLSTGGCPQVLLKRIESALKFNDVKDIFVIEYHYISDKYTIQRNKIKKLLGDNFIPRQINGSKRDLLPLIGKIEPHIIHLEEFPELFVNGIDKKDVDWLYRTDRKYKIVETTHSSSVVEKKYFPDKFLFVSKYSQLQYKKLNIDSDVIEYPIETKEINKSLSQKKLQFDPDYFHVLNVGLFNKNKNQGYVFDIARKLKDFKIKFHFIGNQADNFSDYWKPLMETKPNNCIIHGERGDVELFYQSCDLLIHPSLLELNPLAIKEATSYKLPILLNKLNTYMDIYDNYNNVSYLNMNVDKDVEFILNNFNTQKISENETFISGHVLNYSELLGKKINNIPTLNINNNFNDGAFVDLLTQEKNNFDVEFIDKKNDNVVFSLNIENNHWAKTNKKYFIDWKIKIKNEKFNYEINYNAENKNVLIIFNSKSLGDTLAWLPYTEEFRKKHKCNLYILTYHNHLFNKTYKNINFIEPNEEINISDLYAKYNIGYFITNDGYNINKTPSDPRKLPLQKIASDILGLEYKEIKPKLKKYRKKKTKKVTIGFHSTAQCKYWNNPNGWQDVINYLNDNGYEPIIISKEADGYMTNYYPKDVKHIEGLDLISTIKMIQESSFFIGVSSGLSWLAWACDIPTVIISGFTDKTLEPQNNVIRIINENVCHGCLSDHSFNPNDWNWCPKHKDTDRQFECSKQIKSSDVIDNISKLTSII